MPHLVVEYSRDGHTSLDVAHLMRVLSDAGASTGLIAAGDIKVRALAYDDYLIGGSRATFCHLTVSLLAGRTNEQREELGIAFREALVALLPATHSVSVDIRDMHPGAYKKRLLT